MSDQINRRCTRRVRVGDITIGGGAPVSVQTMTNTDTRDAQTTINQIRLAVSAGAQIIRCAVPDMEAAAALTDIVPAAGVPVVADIHFDYRLAVAAAEAGVHKLRINPGNIGGDDRLRPVIEAARDRGIAIRVGVNAGSLEKELLDRFGHPTPDALAESALRNAERLENMDFRDIVVSIKASDVLTTIAANRKFAERSDIPLHLGITEAGIGRAAMVHSAVGLGALLVEGIGDTLRVSLTGDIIDEVLVGRDILLALGLISGPRLVSCPTCGRCQVDLAAIAAEVEKMLRDIKKPIVVAVMGCEVNGPGEAREADVGLAGGRNRCALFRHGEVLRTVPVSDAVEELRKLIEDFCANGA